MTTKPVIKRDGTVVLDGENIGSLCRRVQPYGARSYRAAFEAYDYLGSLICTQFARKLAVEAVVLHHQAASRTEHRS